MLLWTATHDCDVLWLKVEVVGAKSCSVCAISHSEVLAVRRVSLVTCNSLAIFSWSTMVSKYCWPPSECLEASID